MNIIPSYSMILATATTLIFSLIYMILYIQTKRRHILLWGVSCFIYALMFTLDFLDFNLSASISNYAVYRLLFALCGSFVFLIGSFDFFQKSTPRILKTTFVSVFTILALSVFAPSFYSVVLIPVIIYCSGLLFISGGVFLTNSWTEQLPEKYVTSFLVLLWGIFLNHFEYSVSFLSLAIINYYIGIFIVNALMLFLLIIYFKKASFLDTQMSMRFRLLVENSSDNMFLYDYETSSFEYVSPSISDCIGISESDLYMYPGRFFERIKVEKDSKSLLNIFSKRINSAGNGTFFLTTDDETVVWTVIHYIPIKDKTGTITSIEGILRDITQRKLLEEHIKENEVARTEFLENIQHEIKTPITIIQGYTESLLNKMVPAESYDMYFDIINSKAQLLTTLVNDLTQVTEFDSQVMDFNFYEYDAKELFSDLIEIFTLQIIQAGRKTSCILDIPANITIIADKNRLQQVISNMVNNSIRHTITDSEINLSCLMASSSYSGNNDEDLFIPDGFITFSVIDHGDGFKDSDIPHVFERTFSSGKYLNGGFVEDKKTKGKNFGLGLFISSEIIKNHSGHIDASNNEYGGATISFSIPYYL